MSAFWIFPVFFALAYFVSLKSFATVAAIIFISCRISHTYFSMYLCTFHPEYRKISSKNPIRFHLVPLTIIITLTALFLVPQYWLPWDHTTRLSFYALLIFPFTYWHYALQHYGVIAIYRSRTKQKLTPLHFKMEKAFCHLSTTVLISALTLKYFYDVKFGQFSLSQFLNVQNFNWTFISFAILTPFILSLTYLELKNPKTSNTKLMYLWSMYFMTSVVALDSLLISIALVDMQHFLVVLGLGTHMLAKSEETKLLKSKTKSILTHKLMAFCSISIVLSALYYYFQAHGVNDKAYFLIFDGIIPKSSPNMLQNLFFGLFISFGIAHYYYDRMAFKFSDPDTRAVAKKLI